MESEKETYSLKEVLEIKTQHLKEVSELKSRLGDLAIQKAETAMTERMEASNNKFALLKEQAAMLPTKGEIDPIRKDVENMKLKWSNQEGRSAQAKWISIAALIISAIIGILSLIINFTK